MDLKKLREILKIVAESDVAEVEIDEDGVKVTVRKDTPTVTLQSPAYYPPPPQYYPPPGQHVSGSAFYPDQAAVPSGAEQPKTPDSPFAPEATADNETIVRAPIVGTYYQSPSPDSDVYVKIGSSVTEGTVLCIIEAMKLMNEIECEVAGTIRQILVKDGEPVEYDQPLFVVETA